MGVVGFRTRRVRRVDAVGPAAVAETARQLARGRTLRNDGRAGLGADPELAQLALDLTHLADRFDVHVLPPAQDFKGLVQLIVSEGPARPAADDPRQLFLAQLPDRGRLAGGATPDEPRLDLHHRLAEGRHPD